MTQKSGAVKYYFKLKHDIQNDSELDLARFEVEKLVGKPVENIINLVDFLSEQPLKDFISHDGYRSQDAIMRLPYCGMIQGYCVKSDPIDCTHLVDRLAYFREFYVLCETDDRAVARKLLPSINLEKHKFKREVRFYGNLLPNVQLMTVKRRKPKMLFRFIPLHVLYEPSHYVSELAKNIDQADRMYETSMRHFQQDFQRPYLPSSARWWKTIEDFIDERDAPQLYLTHYIGVKGKFFPRMVRAIINGIGIKKGELLLDPMCGSGTMNLESILCGINTIGVDFQPLFSELTRIKMESLKWNVEQLRGEIEELLKNIRLNLEAEIKTETLSTFIIEKPEPIEISLPRSLMRGVNEKSLKTVEIIMSCIRDRSDPDVQRFCELAIAYWARSMLKKQAPEKIVETFSQRLWSMFFSIYYFSKFKKDLGGFELGQGLVFTGDAKNLQNVIKPGLDHFGKEYVDVIVTSPPYGSAIDYLKEHVYALYVLGLTNDHLKLDKEHIGSPRVDSALEEDITSKSDDFLALPEKAQEILKRMVEFNRGAKATIFYKYFVDMIQVFRQMSNVLAPHKNLVMIVGKEQTVKLDSEIATIDLGGIMEHIGMNVGFQHLRSIDIGLRKASERGAIPTEHVMFFRKAR